MANQALTCLQTLTGCNLMIIMASRLLRQPPDWRSEEDDRQFATCPQLGSTNRLGHAQVRPGTHSFPAKSATLAGRCRPDLVQSLHPGVQMSAPEYLSTYCQPVSGISGRRHDATCDRPTVVISTSHVWNLLRTVEVHLHTPAFQIWTHFLLTLREQEVSSKLVFLFYLLSATSKPFSFLYKFLLG